MYMRRFNTNQCLEFEIGHVQEPERHVFCCWWVTVCVLQAVQWRPAPTLRKTPHQGERLSLILLLRVCPCMHRVCFRILTLIKKGKKRNKKSWSKYLNPPPGSQQAKRGTEDSKGESGEEAAGGAESGASLLSFYIFLCFIPLSNSTGDIGEVMSLP